MSIALQLTIALVKPLRECNEELVLGPYRNQLPRQVGILATLINDDPAVVSPSQFSSQHHRFIGTGPLVHIIIRTELDAARYFFIEHVEARDIKFKGKAVG